MKVHDIDLVVAIFPGIPIVIHGSYFLSVRITLRGDTLIVVDWAGDPFISYPRRQEIALSHVAYVYHLQKEAKAHNAKTRRLCGIRSQSAGV